MPNTEEPRAENATQLRAAIDAGAARDKVDYPDPAAAPLGTDDEAAGVPPETTRVRRQPLWPAASRNAQFDRLIYPALAAVIGAAYLAIVVLAG